MMTTMCSIFSSSGETATPSRAREAGAGTGAALGGAAFVCGTNTASAKTVIPVAISREMSIGSPRVKDWVRRR